MQAGRPGVGVAAQPLDDVDLGLRNDDDVGDDHQKNNKDQREDHKKQDHNVLLFSREGADTGCISSCGFRSE